MAAKEEAAVLKYLKKNPSQEALDISFAIDIDEDVVKQALAVLQGKGEVESKDVGGRAQWSLAAPKPKPAPAPKAEKVESSASDEAPAPKKEKAPKPEADCCGDDECCSKGGVSKGFVFGIGAVVLVLAVGVGYVLGGMQAKSAAQALADTEVKAVRDSIGLVKVSLNQRLDNVESQIRDLKAFPKAEEPADKPDAKKAAKKAPAKPAKKKRK